MSGFKKTSFLAALTLSAALLLPACASSAPQPSASPTSPVAAAASSFADGRGLALGFKLLYALDSFGGNGVLGTTCLSEVMAAVKDGAAGKTDEALAAELGMQDMLPRQINDVALHMRQAVEKLTKGKISTAWGLFIGEQQYIKQGYINDCIQSYLLTPTFPDKPLDKDSIGKYLSEWVDDKTGGRVKDVNFNMPDFSAPFFVDVLTADTDWQTALDAGKSRPLPFRFEDGTDKAVPTMVCLQICGIWESPEGSMAILPTSGDETRLVIMQPPDGMNLHDFIPVAAANHDDWAGKAVWGTQRVLLPRFTLKYEGSALPVLDRAGLAGLLSKGADYSNLGTGLFFSDILHKASLVVDESGVDDPDPNAATYRLNNTDGIRTLAVDRPFIVMLEKTEEDSGTGQALMMGFVRDPLNAGAK